MRTLTRRQLLTAYLLLLIVLILGSSSRRVGDGGEYLDMADKLARLLPPRRYAHFWFYPALAAPMLWIVRLAGVNQYLAFTLVNLALLGAAFWLASGVLRWPALLLLFASPIVWWIDKAHTEVFTFSLLTIAFVALGSPGVRSSARTGVGAGREGLGERASALHPGWAIACLGAAGTQNPPIAALAALAIPFLVLTGRASLRDRRFIVLCLAGFLLAALHPAYYSLVRGGPPFPLANSTHGRIPNIDELTAVVIDTNIGLIVNAPILALGVVLATGFLLVRFPRLLLGADTGLSLCAAAIFLESFAQTTNVNSGGTPGMSRYALWLIPLSLPFLRRFDRAPQPAALREATAWVAALSSVWSLATFHPRWPEDYGKITWVANWLWANYPWLDRPVPEVFIERLANGDVDWWLPATTPQCEKILLTGRGPGVPVWPIPCFPTPLPATCMEAGVLCYANRHGTTYSFSKVPPPSYWDYRFDEDGVWTAAESHTVGTLLRQLRWWEMRVCIDEVVRGAVGVTHQRNYCANDRLFVYLKNTRPGATLRVRLPVRMSGAFIDAATGQEVERVTDSGEPGQLWDLPVPAPHPSLVLVLTQTK